MLEKKMEKTNDPQTPVTLHLHIATSCHIPSLLADSLVWWL
jgi:hypothetical protein